ncbi:MAG: preprotein translocase subunit SecY [Candidatus Bathyarchaeia archaeon]|nr:preprotein translocase subunit SecY [Candidatus Bathyarchaeota archaeon]
MVRFIELFKPLARFLPDISSPKRKVSFNERLLWTGLVLIIYFIMSEIPLYGVGKGGAQDPFGALRIIFASHRGTLMELGIGPIVTAGLILQILAGSKMINVDLSDPSDRALFTSASKVLAVFMTLFEALAYLIGGAYGKLNFQTQAIILLQLLAAGIVIMLMDELLQKGWGFGSGISLFIAAGVAQTIWWNSVAPLGPMADGKYLGALVAFAQSLKNLSEASKAFYRSEGLPDMIGFITTIAIFMAVIYLNRLRVEVPVSYAKFRGFRGRYPIKLLYVSNIPVIFASALFGNIYFISQILWSRYNSSNSNFWLNLLGTFDIKEGHYQPSGGLVYYVISPKNLSEALSDPIRAVANIILMMVTCVFFAVTWVEVAGMDAKSIAKQLLDSGMQIGGFRRSSFPIQKIFEKYIPAVTILGGLLIGLIAVTADFFGAFGSGVGILLMVGILEQYYEILMRERMLEMYPGLSALMGKK